MGPPPGSLHITTLHGSLILLGGLTPPDPPYFAHWIPLVANIRMSTQSVLE